MSKTKRSRCLRWAVVLVFGLALMALLAGCRSGGSDGEPEGLPEGAFPADLRALNQVIHLRIVTDQIDTKNTQSADLWLRSSTGDFLWVERKDSEIASVAACDGSSFKSYDVASHRACNFTVAKLLSVEPDTLTSRRGSLENLKEWATDIVTRSGKAGEPTVLRGRAALTYSSIDQGRPASNTKEVNKLDLVVDKSTGLPLQAVVHQANGDLVSRTDYDYEVASVPEGGFSLVFPEDYYVQTDEDLNSPAEENLTVGELVRAAKHDVYWVGANFEARPLTSSTISPSGVVTLKYGEHPSSPGKSPASPLVSVYEYVPSQLDPDILSNIEGQLTDPKPVEGKRGTYTLYKTALNGMPTLEAVIGDVHILIADVEDGDVGVMVRAADALVKAAN